MKIEKIIGYLLLIAGISVIVASGFSLYQVFTGRKEAPQVFSFKMPGISLPISQTEIKLPEGINLPTGVQLPEGLLGQNSGEKSEIKLLPDEPVNQITNMSIYLLLMGFLVSVGGKIASLGVQLIKEIKVVVKEEKIKEAIQEAPQDSI